mgnify:CR=1 FL=1
MIEKSYWVIFEDTYVLHHEAFIYRKKIFYKEAKYIIIGEPYIRPNKSLSKRFMKNWVIISMFYPQTSGYYFLFAIRKNY